MSTDNHAAHGKHHHAHHFRDAMHEFLSAKEGIWLFMVTEILMFGGLFVAYLIYHNIYPETFLQGAETLSWKMGALNTFILLFSSWTMAMSIHCIQTNQKSKATKMLITTILCGFAFMVVKYFEYTGKIHHGFLPGKFFAGDPAQFTTSNPGLYFSFYFCMTGLHGIHVLLGMSLIGWVLKRHLNNEFDEHYYTAVEGVGIFWHIVDLVWIFLFPLLYLVG
jgi:cytochrome c oxidase subunit 3